MYHALVSIYYTIKRYMTKVHMVISLKDSQLALFKKIINFIINARKTNSHTVISISINRYHDGYIAKCILTTPYGRLIVGVDNTDHIKYILESYTGTTGVIDYVGKCGLSYSEFVDSFNSVIVVTHALDLYVFDKE